jgi:Domain of unknown function (DUF4760)
MSDKYQSADLILKLYDLRREEKMREARSWWETFFPETLEDILLALDNTEAGAKLRMVISYWEMGAGMVNHGAIDEEMYNDSAGEQFLVFAKIHPFIKEIREKFDSPDFLKNFEALILRMPDAEARLAKRRAMAKQWVERRTEAAKAKI